MTGHQHDKQSRPKADSGDPPQSYQDAAISLLNMSQSQSQASYKPWQAPETVAESEAHADDWEGFNESDKVLGMVNATNAVATATAALALAQLQANEIALNQAKLHLAEWQLMQKRHPQQAAASGLVVPDLR